MKKVLSLILCLVIFSTFAFANIDVFAKTKTITGKGVTISLTTERELKNYQQCLDYWKDYKPNWPGAAATIGNAGCGLVSLCNVVHYVTGYFMDPRRVADYALYAKAYYADYTREILYNEFYTDFHDQLGFTATNSKGDVDPVQQVGDGSKNIIINHIKNGGALVGRVYNHYIGIVDYNSKTDKFLVWDNCAGTFDTGGAAYSGNRINITHVGGDWMTWEQMRGSLPNNRGEYDKFSVYEVMPIDPVPGKQEWYTGRQDLLFGTAKLQNSGECCNFTPVNFSQNNGNPLNFKGVFASTNSITKIGYKVDGGDIVWNDSFMKTPTDAQLTEGKKWSGSNAYVKGFDVKVPVSSATKRVDVVAYCGGENKIIWTALAQNNSGTAVYGSGNTPVTINTYTARDEIICGGDYVINKHGDYPSNFTHDFSAYVGKTISFCGWFATTEADISSFGISVDDGNIKYNTAYKSSLTKEAQGCADSNVGVPNFAQYFIIPVEVTAGGNHTYKLYAKVGSKDVWLWTIYTTGIPSTSFKPTAKPTSTATVKPSGGQTANPTSTETVKPSGGQTANPSENPTTGYTPWPTGQSFEDETPSPTFDPTGNSTDIPDATDVNNSTFDVTTEAPSNTHDAGQTEIAENTPDHSDNPSEDTKPDKKGCIVACTAGIAVLVVLISLAIVLLLKKK